MVLLSIKSTFTQKFYANRKFNTQIKSNQKRFANALQMCNKMHINPLGQITPSQIPPFFFYIVTTVISNHSDHRAQSQLLWPMFSTVKGRHCAYCQHTQLVMPRLRTCLLSGKWERSSALPLLWLLHKRLKGKHISKCFYIAERFFKFCPTTL